MSGFISKLIGLARGRWYTLTGSTGTGNRSYVRCSGDGQIILVPHYNNYCKLSTDGGLTWTSLTNLGVGFWYAACVSKDGSTLYVASGGLSDGTFKSTDQGATWSSVNSAGGIAMCCSADGSKVFVATSASGGNVLYSSDAGNTWATGSGTVYLSQFPQMVCSDDGVKIYTALNRSVDSGATWAALSGVSVNVPTSVCCSADGSIVYIVKSSADNTAMIRSINSGATWSNLLNAGTVSGGYVTCSGDGNFVYINSGSLKFSTDAGATWATDTSAGFTGAFLTSNSDGTIMYGSPVSASTNISKYFC